MFKVKMDINQMHGSGSFIVNKTLIGKSIYKNKWNFVDIYPTVICFWLDETFQYLHNSQVPIFNWDFSYVAGLNLRLVETSKLVETLSNSKHIPIMQILTKFK